MKPWLRVMLSNNEKDILSAERINLLPSPGLILYSSHIVTHAHALAQLLYLSVKFQKMILLVQKMMLPQVQMLIMLKLKRMMIL